MDRGRCIPGLAVLRKEISIETFAPLTVPLGVIETTEGSPPWHCDRSFDGQTSVFAAPVNVYPVCVKSVYHPASVRGCQNYVVLASDDRILRTWSTWGRGSCLAPGSAPHESDR
jgi:hypothetical protein